MSKALIQLTQQSGDRTRDVDIFGIGKIFSVGGVIHFLKTVDEGDNEII